MIAIYIILGIVAYLAIGGFLAGLFEEMYFDSFAWYLAWPVVLLIVLCLFMEIPFELLGRNVRDWIRQSQNRNKK